MASRVGLNYQALGGWKIKHGLTKCYTVPDILPVHAWCSSVRAWYFICPCLIFICHVLDIFIYPSCLMFIYHMLDVLSVRAWYFSCSCLMFYLFVLDVLSVHAWCFYRRTKYQAQTHKYQARTVKISITWQINIKYGQMNIKHEQVKYQT